MDLQQHRLHEGTAQAAGLRLRLGPRAGDLRPGLLPLGAVAVHPADRQGPGVSQDRHGQLGSGRPDRAGQRAGDRRQRLALRRAGGEARHRAMVRPHHRLRPGAARRPRRAAWLARAGGHDAAQLDRPLGRRADAVCCTAKYQCRGRRNGRPRGRRDAGDLHNAPGHADGRHLCRRRRRAPAGAARRRRGPRNRRVHRGVPSRRRQRGRARDHGEEGDAARHRRAAPRERRTRARVRRQLRADGLWHRRGHGGPGARPARLGVRRGLRHREAAGDLQRRWPQLQHRPRGLRRKRGAGQLRAVRRPDLRGRVRRDRGLAGEARQGRTQGQLPSARLGRVAPALLGLPHPGDPQGRRAHRARQRAAGPAAGGRDRRRFRLAAEKAAVLLRSGRRRHPRDRHLRHLRRVQLVLRALLLPRRRARHARRARPLLAAGGPVRRRHRARHPAPPVRPLLQQADARRRGRRGAARVGGTAGGGGQALS